MKKIIKALSLLIIGLAMFITSCGPSNEDLSNQKNDLIVYVDQEIDTLETSLINTISETIAKIEELETKFDAKTKELEDVDNQIKDIQDKHKNDLETLNKELETLTNEYNKKVKELEDLDKELQASIKGLEDSFTAQNKVNEEKHSELLNEIVNVEGCL